MEKLIIPIQSTDEVSDGYHTFKELYEHRITLFIALCKQIESDPKYQNFNEVWRAVFHSDGSQIKDWFVLGIGKGKGEQITYHLPIDKWGDCEFAQHLEKAPEFDGHTPQDVLDRINKLT